MKCPECNNRFDGRKCPECGYKISSKKSNSVALKIIIAVAVIIVLAVSSYLIIELLGKSENTASSDTSPVNQQNQTSALTKEQEMINDEYNDSPDDYLYVDMRMYIFPVESSENKNDIKEDATEMYNYIKDEPTFVGYAKKINLGDKEYDADSMTKLFSARKKYITDNISKELAEWAFSANTKSGSKKGFVIKKNKEVTGYGVALMLKTKHDVSSVNIRNIFFRTADENGEELSEKEVAAAEKNANKVFAEFNAGDKSEKSFSELAKKYTEDTATKKSGGYFENVLPGMMVRNIDNWIFDSQRKNGDAEIVRTEYGYYIMYFINKNSSAKDYEIREELKEKGYIK